MIDLDVAAKSPALAHPARALDNKSGAGSGVGQIRFSVGANDCIDVSGCIVEVATPPPLTPVPACAEWFLGLASYQGDILPVTDMGRWSGSRASTDSANARLLVMQAAGERFGLIVDAVQGLSNDTIDVRPFESRNSHLGRIVSGTASIGEQVLLIVDLSVLAILESFVDIKRKPAGDSPASAGISSPSSQGTLSESSSMSQSYSMPQSSSGKVS